MKFIKKKWKIILSGLLLLALIGYLALTMLLGSIVRTGVEIFAPKLTGTPVLLGSCGVSLLRGRIELRDFEIKNPEGFRTTNAFVMKRLIVEVAPLSILSQKIDIREFLIEGLEVTYEQQLTSSNLTTIKSNMDKFSKAAAKEEKAAAEKPVEPSGKPSETAKEEKPPKKFQIDSLDIKDVAITVSLLSGPAVSLRMPPLHMEKLGQKGDGTSAAEISVEVMLSLFEGIFKAIKDNSSKLGGVLDGVKDAGGSIVDGVKSLF